MKDLNYYLSLPYVATIRPDEEVGFVARIEDLPGCSADGTNRAEALERLDDLKRAWIEDALEAGHLVPEPALEEDLPSGKWLQRVPKSLHRKLSNAARKDGVSLNSLVCTILAEALGSKAARELPPGEFALGRVDASPAVGFAGATEFCSYADSAWAEDNLISAQIVTNHTCSQYYQPLGLAQRLHLLVAKFPKNSKKNLKVFHDQEEVGEFRKA
jgi:antitoxin HicB